MCIRDSHNAVYKVLTSKMSFREKSKPIQKVLEKLTSFGQMFRKKDFLIRLGWDRLETIQLSSVRAK